MSVERITQKAVLVTATAKVARELFAGFSGVCRSISAAADGVADAILLVESDAARRYEALTGIDLSDFTEEPGVYSGSRAEEISFDEGDVED